MQTVLIVLHVVLSVSIIVLVLLQRGKGADAGAALGGGGGGSSASLFGARGSANFLSRSTSILATAFFLTSLALAYFATNHSEVTSVVDTLAPAVQQQTDSVQQDDVPVLPQESSSDMPAPAAE